MSELGKHKSHESIALLHFLSVVAAVLLGFMWFVSPLGLGFATWPEGDLGKRAHRIYELSYFTGLSILAAGQILGIVIAFCRRPGTGLILSLLSLAIFLIPVIWFMRLMP